MDSVTFDTVEPWQAVVRLGDDPGGIALNSAKAGESVKILAKTLLTSYDDNHRRFFNQILYGLLKVDRHDINQVLVVIRQSEFRTYFDFPMMMKARAKGNIREDSAVHTKDILDITEVDFRDDTRCLDIRDGDKIAWLFRIGWSFGLYFDFTGKMKISELRSELGRSYRRVLFYSHYEFLQSEGKFARMLEHGWFPFAQILDDEFEKLMLHIDDPDNLNSIEEEIANSFTRERIHRFTQYWWKNEIFRDKQALLEAGIHAYLSGDDQGTINCISNLTPQIEGIIYLDYHRKMGNAPTTAQWRKYLEQRANESFPDPWSLGFPGRFLEYVKNVFLRSFDIESGDVELSRHSVAHGVACRESFTRIRALQLILTLDQIRYCLQRPKLPDED